MDLWKQNKKNKQEQEKATDLDGNEYKDSMIEWKEVLRGFVGNIECWPNKIWSLTEAVKFTLPLKHPNW